MAKDPAFLFYSKDFYEGTRMMLPEERACYIDLLIYQHQNGFIPDDLKRVVMYCGGIDKATLEATLKAKFKLCLSGWYNEKLDLIINERKEFSSKQSLNGKIGQFFKKAKGELNGKEYIKVFDFLKKSDNEEKLKIINEYEKGNEGSLQAMLKAMLKHIADVNAIEDENKDLTKEERCEKFSERVWNENELYATLNAQEVEKFINYWTESGDNQKKIRFELERVFDIKKRMATWAANNLKFTANGNQKRNSGGSKQDQFLESVKQHDYTGIGSAAWEKLNNNNPQQPQASSENL